VVFREQSVIERLTKLQAVLAKLEEHKRVSLDE